jgi:hypothetical protein
MFVEMSCKCGSMINIDGFTDSLSELITIRFLEAHVACGFVTPVNNSGSERTIRRDFDIRKIVRMDDDED